MWVCVCMCKILWPPEEAFKNWFSHTLNYVCIVSVSWRMRDSVNPGVYIPHECAIHLWVYFLELLTLYKTIVVYLYMYTTFSEQLGRHDPTQQQYKHVISVTEGRVVSFPGQSQVLSCSCRAKPIFLHSWKTSGLGTRLKVEYNSVVKGFTHRGRV